MATIYSVAIYNEQLAYGGPEEGGWWYDAGEIVARPVRYFRDEEQAFAYARRINRHLHNLINDRKRYRYSDVNSDGRIVADVHAGHPPQFYPQERPRYS